MELQQIIKEELVLNPFLEEVDEFAEVEDQKTDGDENPLEREEQESAGPENEEVPEVKDEIDWTDFVQDDLDRSSIPQSESNTEFFEKVPVRRESLAEHLTNELHLLPLSDDDLALGEIIVGSLDDRGLATPIEELAEFARATVEDVLRVLALVQTLEPAGWGRATCASACSSSSGRAAREDPGRRRIIEQQFENLKNNKRADIARALKVTMEQVQEATDSLGTLSPKPGFELSAEEVKYVVPDLIVERVGEEYVAFLNDRNVPRLRINAAYQSVLKGKSGSEERKYVNDKLSAAKWLIGTIEQRRRTMINVMTCIIQEQREFFDKGIQFLRPLTLQTIARQIGVHESTVSRATNNKYVQTPRGIFRLDSSSRAGSPPTTARTCPRAPRATGSRT